VTFASRHEPFPNLRERLRLTLVVGREQARPRTIKELAEAAFAGGVTALQLREKNSTDADLYRLALSLSQFCQERGKIFIINDRLDVALAVNADGLHLGQDDLPLAVARRHWPRPKILGATAKTPKDALEAERAGADYLGVGAIFPSPSKPGAPLLLQKTWELIRQSSLPLVGIGGISIDNAALAWSYGFDGLAVVSALARAEDPVATAKKLANKP
jgi:thiamine-phosphate pyrophosphorylase